MPVWVDDSHIDSDWLCAKLGIKHEPICSVQDISNQGRLGTTVRDGGTLLLTMEEQHQQFVIKQVPSHKALLSQQLGLAREALFYKLLAPLVSTSKSASSLPHVYYAHGDMVTGEKFIVMEALLPDWLDSGIFFGPGNPNNWKRDIPALLATAYGSAPVPSAATVAKATFVAIAHMHAAFWKKKSLLEESNHWLRGHAWLQGREKATWEASQALIQGIWKEYTVKEAKEGDTFVWNPIVREAVEKAATGISWQAQLDRLSVDGLWTLVHGDFWPGNVMLHITDGSLRMLDWEMVGLGSGPQDLGQYVLSNMDPAERRACERELIQAYYEELMRNGIEDDGDLWEYCWKEYTVGGVERWLWFLIYFVGQPGMTDWAQFFHNQIAEFMVDHKLTAHDITQPRP
jgi:Ecdysteroid kinase-like family